MRKLITLLLSILTLSSYAQLSVSNVISDHVVLQRNTEAAIWGWNENGKQVTVEASWGAKKTTTTVDGKWKVKIPTSDAGGPYTITITDGAKTITVKDILLGEVWLASGQSNMEWKLTDDFGKDANYPEIRFVNMRNGDHDDGSVTPMENHDLEWKVCTPSNVHRKFSAVAYFFARKLYQELNVPVGIIVSAKGGSSIQAWTPMEAYKTLDPDFIMPDVTGIKVPVGLYNSYIHPIINHTIKGAIWYQGESNSGDYKTYAKMQSLMLQAWRDKWNQGNFPFYYFQIPRLRYGNAANFRDGQRKALYMLPNVGMSVNIDLGSEINHKDSVHFYKTPPTGERLAYWALAKDYGKKIQYTGPIPYDCKMKNGKAIIRFYGVGSGLKLTDGSKSFEIAGADGIYHSATARISRNKLIVASSEVNHPKTVRYAFAKGPDVTFFNKEGLLATPFILEDGFHEKPPKHKVVF